MVNTNYLIGDSAIIPGDSASTRWTTINTTIWSGNPRVNSIKEQVTLIEDLNEKLLSLSTELNELMR